jgi:hypothetical protein
MAGSMTKRGRGKQSRTPWQILQDFQETGDLDDWDLWAEFEQASKGRRALVWSPGLKAQVGVDEVSDEAIAEEAEGSSEDAVFTLTGFGQAVRNRSRLGGEILNVLAADGGLAAMAFCVLQGLLVRPGGIDWSQVARGGET